MPSALAFAHWIFGLRSVYCIYCHCFVVHKCEHFMYRKAFHWIIKYMDHARCVREQENAPFVTIDEMKWALLQVLQPIINKATLPVGIKFLGNWMLQIVWALWHLIYSIRYRNDYAIVRFDKRIKKPCQLNCLLFRSFISFFCVSVSDADTFWKSFGKLSCVYRKHWRIFRVWCTSILLCVWMYVHLTLNFIRLSNIMLTRTAFEALLSI